MRRAGVVLSGIVVTLVVAACSSSGNNWEDEFTPRLEGASRSIEEAATTMRTETSGAGYPEVFIPLSQTLGHRAELIEQLDPPDGCEEIQDQGYAHVSGVAGKSYEIPRDMTPQLEATLPGLLDEEVEALEQLEREAKTCAAG